MAKKALVVCESLSDNIGDSAISKGMAQMLLDYGFDVDCVDYSFKGQPSELRLTALGLIHHLVGNNFPRSVRLVRSFRELELNHTTYEMAVIGGGQLILDNGIFPLQFFIWSKRLRRIADRLFLVSSGCGRNFGLKERYMIRHGASLMDGIYLRDSVSISNFKSNFDRHAGFIPDVAYWHVGHSFEKSPQVSNSGWGNYGILAVCDYSVHLRYYNEVGGVRMTREEYYHKWLTIFDEMVDQGLHVLMVTTTKNDCIESMRFFKWLTPERKKFVINIFHTTSFEKFIKLSQKAETVSSARMHALIFGHIAGTKLRPFIISQKINSFCNEYPHKDTTDIKIELSQTFSKLLNQ